MPRGFANQSSMAYPEVSQPTFRQTIMRKTPGLKRQESFERGVLARDFQQEVQDWMDASVTNPRAVMPNPTDILTVRRKYGMDTGPITAFLSQNKGFGSWNRKAGTTAMNIGGGQTDMGGQTSRLSDQYMGPRPAAGTNAQERPVGTRINPNSFSAGSSKWAGRVQDSVAGADTTKGESVRDMRRQEGGLSLAKEGSLMVNPRVARNRATEQSRTVIGAFDAFDRSTREGTYDDPNSQYFEENDNAYQKQFLTQRNERGGDVDPKEYLASAMRNGLGDEKLIRAAMRGGDVDLGKRYKNLRSMGVV